MRTTEIHGKTYQIDSQGAFTPAEEVALDYWLQAMSVEDAARAAHRSPDTVKSHRKAIRQKTFSRNGEGVLMYCFSKGYVRALLIVLAAQATMPQSSKPYSEPVRRESRSKVKAARSWREMAFLASHIGAAS